MLIGKPLSPEEVVYWVVARPGRPPTAADKAQALAGMQELFAKVDARAAGQGTSGQEGSAAEFEAAVDQAVERVRSQSDT